MRFTELSIPGVLLVEPDVFGDERGFFMETYRESRYAEIGICGPFVQENISQSRQGVLRGLHVQHPHGQGKLVSVLEGEVFDVSVDVRVGSPTYGRWCGECISAQNKRQLYMPPGFAHGFLVTSNRALLTYKCTEYYHPETELAVRWDDPAIGIRWPMAEVVLSAKDRNARLLGALTEQLPHYGS